MGEYDALFDDDPPKPSDGDPGDYAGLYDVDMSAGSPARRAAAGRTAGPRELTDEEAGVDSGLVTAKATETIVPGLSEVRTSQPQGAATRAQPSDAEITVTKRHPGTGEGIVGAFGKPATIVVRKPEGEYSDPIVQMLAAAAMGRVAGAGAGILAPAPIAPAVSSAVEGGTASKVSGGDFTTGAVLAGAVPAAKALGRAVADVKLPGQTGAPARVAARSKRNLTEEATTQGRADKIVKAAGPDGQALDEVLARNDDLRHALAVHAKDRPAAALKAVSETKGAANAARNADFETMQMYWADKPASAQASIPQLIDDFKAVKKTILTGDRVGQKAISEAQKELIKFADELREVQGLPPAVNGDYSGTIVSPKDLRAFEQTVGAQAFEAAPQAARGQARASVGAALYKPIARQVNALAEATPGVDAKRFATTGQDLHVLIPIEDDLAVRVAREAQNRKGLLQLAKEASRGIAALGYAGRVAGRVGRGIDYRLAERQLRNLSAAQAARTSAAPARPAIAPAAAGVAAGQAQQRPVPPVLIPAPAQ